MFGVLGALGRGQAGSGATHFVNPQLGDWRPRPWRPPMRQLRSAVAAQARLPAGTVADTRADTRADSNVSSSL